MIKDYGFNPPLKWLTDINTHPLHTAVASYRALLAAQFPLIQTYNKGYQRDSQRHIRHVCDATYPAMLVTHACGLVGK